jgi:hypothetical protein
MINNSYNSLNITNKYNVSTSTNSTSSSNLNPNFLNKIIINIPEYTIKLSDIYYYPNLTYIANSQCNIYLPDVSVNPFYTNISFKIINNISDSIFLLSTSEKCLINSTFFNSVQGDKDMAVEGKRIIQLTSTMINDTYFWNILIN